MITGQGILKFDLPKITKKHNEQTWKKTAMVLTNDDLSSYYSWFLEKRFNLKLLKPLRGSHITVISDKFSNDIFEKGAEIFNNKIVSFEYDITEIRGNGLHWWLKIHSKDFENIRTAIGLTPIPYFRFHLTLGMVNEYNRNHSEYILQTMKNFNL